MNLRKHILFAVTAALSLFAAACTSTSNDDTTASSTPPPRLVPWENTSVVNDNWQYLEKNMEAPAEALTADGWQNVTLPHTWNAKDTLQTAKYRRDASWYRRDFNFTEADLKDKLYLRFGAAGQVATVYVNGQKALDHKGGYSAFAIELNPYAKSGTNTVLVYVSNKSDRNLAPLSGDFNQYGGLYREVRLIRAPQVSIDRNHHAGPGIIASSTMTDGAEATLTVNVALDGKNATGYSLKTILTAPNGKVAAEGKSEKITINGSTMAKAFQGTVKKPLLWSPETPNLYTLTVSLLDDNGKEVDRATVRQGFRWFKFTNDKGFFLNGEHYRLFGTNRHQDYRGEGNALSDIRHDTDIRLIKEAGFNFLRLAHYQQDDYILQRCDEIGLLVWEEIPTVNGITQSEAFAANCQSMMTEMITQHYNHPAIVLWGMGNEIWYDKVKGTPRHTFETKVIKDLNDTAHRLDSTRPTVIVSGDINLASDVGIMDIPDVIGYNLYRGWYGGGYETLTKRLNELHDKNPDKPMILSEFGAGADTWIHTENPRRFDFSEEYMINFLESHLDQMDEAPLAWLSGYNWWVFADFGAAHRTDTNPHINNKGLVDFERQKKDGFYYTKARLTKDPVVYLQSPSWTERRGVAEKTYRVFSNMDSVELFQDGKSLGKQSKDFSWKVTLKPGKNVLLAKGANKNGTRKEHGFTVNYDPRTHRHAVTASESLNGTAPENTVDDDLKTQWESESGAWLQIDLDRISLVDGVAIDFANKKDKIFNIRIETSSDGKTWEKAFDGKTPKSPSSPYLIPFKQEEARYVKITGLGNNIDSKNAWREVTVKVSFEKQDKILYEKISEGGE
ncbi:MAG: discoidin domain-containing protein [Puniceicoccales bacterium]|nr:discoidin domain-containing protein [Puniceicoccales bacterium]